MKQLLRRNLKAAPHADSIRSALKSIKALREAGVTGKGSILMSPYRERVRLGNLPVSPYKQKLTKLNCHPRNACHCHISSYRVQELLVRSNVSIIRYRERSKLWP